MLSANTVKSDHQKRMGVIRSMYTSKCFISLFDRWGKRLRGDTRYDIE